MPLNILNCAGVSALQQYLPLAVLKHAQYAVRYSLLPVATVLTACGIETALLLQQLLGCDNALQQYLPLAVLKPISAGLPLAKDTIMLQQYLPLAVLKPCRSSQTQTRSR